MSIFTCLGGVATGLPSLPPPASLVPLSAAFSRRAALVGVTVSAGALAGSAARAVTDIGRPMTADADHRLTAMAADICTTLDGAAYAFDPVTDEDEQDRRLGRANALQLEIAALPAVGLAGVLAKAKAYLDSASYDVLHLAELADSLAEDVERVLGTGGAVVIPARVPTGEYRALTVHDVVPAGHIAVPVLHDRWSPHIQAGEFAVLDPSDTEPQLGELYGLMISSPRFASGQVMKIVQPYRSKVFGHSDGAVMFLFGASRPGRMVAADGPLRREWWHRTCRGRVVGILPGVDVEGAHA